MRRLGPGEPPSGFGSALGAADVRCSDLRGVSGVGGGVGGSGRGIAISISRSTTSAQRVTGTLRPMSKARPSAAWTTTTAASA